MLEDLKDEVVGKAIDTGMGLAQGKEEEKKQTGGQMVLRFFVTLIWVILALIFSLGGAFLMVGHDYQEFFEGDSALGYIGIGVALLFAIITFCVPYLRKKGSTTRWCGIVLLGDAIWWAYLMFSSAS